MAITPKEKELVAVGISVATGCKPCTDFHIKAVRKARASDNEIKQAMAAALEVRKRATEIMGAYALAHLGEKREVNTGGRADEITRLTELVSVGAAFGVNCVATLERHLAAAKAVGISQEEITTIVQLATFIKGKAASHVEHLVGVVEEKEVAAHGTATSACS